MTTTTVRAKVTSALVLAGLAGAVGVGVSEFAQPDYQSEYTRASPVPVRTWFPGAHRVEFRVDWSPASSTHIEWQAPPIGDQLDLRRAPWTRTAWAASGAVLVLLVRSRAVREPNGSVTCITMVDNISVAHDHVTSGACKLTYVIP